MIDEDMETGTIFVPNCKRKEVDDVSEDFSDFSISAPARKIRRLDSELPPVIEDAEEDIVMVPSAHLQSNGVEKMELNPGKENPERALMLYNAGGSVDPLFFARPDVTLSMDFKLIAGLKNKHKLHFQDDEDHAKRSLRPMLESYRATNGCLAVVPWTPCIPSAPDTHEAIESEMDVTAMEIEDIPKSTEQVQGLGFAYGGFPQWQQQQCMIPQAPRQNTTPITWFR